ncbi:MAG: type II secretion system protein [Candidatus Gastranaerophilales bacterium]|nr:type II secretion system protein [Candidatus Gastranaerophilales bacterium]
MKKAFTLAELLIVLVVLGILAAVLMPVAFQSAPDENVLKFKKANNTLGAAVHQLVSSEQYSLNGNLRFKADGTEHANAKFFCESFADVISTKSVNCSDTTSSPSIEASGDFDTPCKNKQLSQIVASDNVTYWVYATGTAFDDNKNTNNFYDKYKVFCFDVDGINKGEAPFGYGIRIDGKVIPGARAKEWALKSVQKGS